MSTDGVLLAAVAMFCMGVLASLWFVRADREAEGFERNNRRILRALVAVCLLSAVAILATQWPG